MIGLSSIVRGSAGAVASPMAWQCNVLCLGDSVTATAGGDPSTDPAAWPNQLKLILPGSASGIHNLAQSGWDTDDVLDDFDTSVAPLLPTETGAPAIASIHIGTNDFASGDEEGIYANIQSIWAQLRAGGCKVVAWLPNATLAEPGGTTWDDTRLAVQALILGDASLYDLAITQRSVIDNPGNTYWYSDGTHLTTVGARDMAQLFYASANRAGLPYQ